MSIPPQPTEPYAAELAAALSAVRLASLLTKYHLLNHLSKPTLAPTPTPTSTSTSAPASNPISTISANVPQATKPDTSEVTTADFASQALIISLLHHAYPSDVFIAEENADLLRSDPGLCARVFELLSSVRGLVPALGGERVDRDRERERGGGGGGDENRGAVVLHGLPRTEAEMCDVIDLGSKGGVYPTNEYGDGQGGNEGMIPRTWILDPIDGTRTYIKGQQYAVCLALVHGGEQKVGVLGCPNLRIELDGKDGRVLIREDLVDLSLQGGYVVSAVKGQGTRIRKMLDQTGTDLEEWRRSPGCGSIDHEQERRILTSDDDHGWHGITFTDSGSSPHTSQELHRDVFRHFNGSAGREPDALDIWSMQMKYVVLALRAVDVMVRVPPDPEYHACVWDHAGGQLLLTESGGVLSDAHGKGFVLDGRNRRLVHNWGVCAVGSAVAADGDKSAGDALHRDVLGKIKEGLAKGKETIVP